MSENPRPSSAVAGLLDGIGRWPSLVAAGPVLAVVAALAAAAALAACGSVGPDYRQPDEAIASQPAAGRPFAEADPAAGLAAALWGGKV